jgi:hypothetical protein
MHGSLASTTIEPTIQTFINPLRTRYDGVVIGSFTPTTVVVLDDCNQRERFPSI